MLARLHEVVLMNQGVFFIMGAGVVLTAIVLCGLTIYSARAQERLIKAFKNGEYDV